MRKYTHAPIPNGHAYVGVPSPRGLPEDVMKRISDIAQMEREMYGNEFTTPENIEALHKNTRMSYNALLDARRETYTRKPDRKF